ncbi:MAG: SatD family protein, partial [Gemmatimonadota bacterium]
MDEPSAHGPTFFALIGDIVDSRTLPDRSAVQRTLAAAIQRLNRDRTEEMAAPLRIIDGDAVQVLLVAGPSVVDIVIRLAEALHPAAMVWGLGRGGLSTDFSDDVSMIDGPC